MNTTDNTESAPSQPAPQGRVETTEAQIAGKTVYLAGAITGHPDYKAKFQRATDWLLDHGAARVLNPATLPDGWTHAEYMEHCLLMVRRAQVLALLPCWTHSLGAQAERAYADTLKLPQVRLAADDLDPVYNPDNVPADKVPQGYRFGRKSDVDQKRHEGSQYWSTVNSCWKYDNFNGCTHSKEWTFIVPLAPQEQEKQPQEPHTVAKEFGMPPGSFEEFHERTALKEQLEQSQQANRMLTAQVHELQKQLAACQWRPVTQKPTKEDAGPHGDVFLVVESTPTGVSLEHNGWQSPPDNWLGWLPFPHHLLPKSETPEEKNRREFEAYLATLPEASVHRDVWKEDQWNTWQAARAGKEPA